MSTWKVSVQAAILKPLKNVITIMNIIIENLRKNFGEKTAVNINQFEIPSGQILGLVGNNGAGKSTLFRLMLDLIKADEGRVLMGSTDVSQTEEWKSWTGAFVDESFLIDYLTPDEYFQFVARISGTPVEEYQSFLARFEHFMAGELMGQNKLIRNLSAGNKQKVGIVAAMLLRPKVLILDEPTRGIDVGAKRGIYRRVRALAEEKDLGIVCISSELDELLSIADRIYVMANGNVVDCFKRADFNKLNILETAVRGRKL